MRKGKVYIISGPSGVGKTSIANMLLTKANAQSNRLELSISYTTRVKRSGEQDTAAYHFVSEEKFKQLTKENFFLEYAQVYGAYYGTSKVLVQNLLDADIDVLLELDWQGAIAVKKQLLESTSIFIAPPTLASLSERLRARADGSMSRIRYAKQDIEMVKKFDCYVTNNELEHTVNKLLSFMYDGGELEKGADLNLNLYKDE